MCESRRIIVWGNINNEIVGHITHLLREHQINADLEVNNLKKTASIIPTPDIIVTAASIAAVLSFLLNMWKTWHESRKSIDKQQADAFLKFLNHQLQSFGAEGFEIVSIKGIDKTNLKPRNKITITLRDVPGKQIIELETSDEYHVEIQRKKTL